MSDRRITQNMPVELLRDARGIYGIGITEPHDLEALAWSCGLDTEETYILRPPPPLILRPDCLERVTRPYCYGAALQKIVGGFRNGPFKHTAEERLRRFIHHEALQRAGLPRPSHHERWWSSDKAQQARNRGVYHGLRLLSVGVINRLISELHEAAADPDAIRAARRFTLQHRQDIYRACALSRRALQLVEIFRSRLSPSTQAAGPPARGWDGTNSKGYRANRRSNSKTLRSLSSLVRGCAK